MDKRTIQTFSVSIFLFVIFIQWIIPIWFWVKLLCLLVGLVNILGWMMDKYFNKKYGSDTIPFAKDSFPVLFEKQKGYESQAWSSIQWRKIKRWFGKE